MPAKDNTTVQDLKNSVVTCQSSQGAEIRATLLRLTRFTATFEIYNPALVLRASEVLTDFKIIINDRAIYSGRAVVRTLVNTGQIAVCEATLEEGSWMDLDFTPAMAKNGMLGDKFREFLNEWQKLYKIREDYKVIVADMQTFFTDLRLWLEQVELGIRSSPAGDRLQLEQDVAESLSQSVIPCMNELFEKFESIAQTLDEETLPAHRNYMRRQLHPLVLCSPFAYRTFAKPLGYAGDYEMVNMIIRNTQEGGSLFAKVINTWFLRQPPAQAHRNRIEYLIQKLQQETRRAAGPGRPARILSVACGPSQEVQFYMTRDPLCDQTHFTLLDFNEETLQYLRNTLGETRAKYQRRTPLEYIKKSVHHILKESGRTVQGDAANKYDFVYCAGLFDYLSNQVCQRLTNAMYDWVAPGGLLVTTNVEPSNPLRNGMEHLLDWNLIYRSGEQMFQLKPQRAPEGVSRVQADETGVNVFMEARKPANA